MTSSRVGEGLDPVLPSASTRLWAGRGRAIWEMALVRRYFMRFRCHVVFDPVAIGLVVAGQSEATPLLGLLMANQTTGWADVSAHSSMGQ